MNRDDAAQAHTALATLVGRFAKAEIAPHVSAWEEAGEFPRSLYRRAAELGLLGIGYPQSLGGGDEDDAPTPMAVKLGLWIALARYGTSGGVFASLLSHNIGMPPVLAYGSVAIKTEVLPAVLCGNKISALCITEHGGGSDVVALRTTATLDGDHYVVRGEKTFITSGLRADWLTVAVRSGAQRGAGGISMLLIPASRPGITRTTLDKMGWWCSDTAHIRFDAVRVPTRYLLGGEGAGFKIILGNFNGERVAMAAGALGFAQACYAEALAWAQQRKTFGSALVEHQVIRHKLVDMQMRIRSTLAWTDTVAAQHDNGDSGSDWVASVCLLKNHATQTMQFCADQAVQILGGMGYMRGTVSERIYREVKIMMIGGGSEEIMKELAAKQMGV
jgi:acyl-CoA dehydrogenase